MNLNFKYNTYLVLCIWRLGRDFFEVTDFILYGAMRWPTIEVDLRVWDQWQQDKASLLAFKITMGTMGVGDRGFCKTFV